MGDEADADWQHGLVEQGIEDSKPSKHKCPRCGIVLVNEWPCLSAADARKCETAKTAGVKPKLRLVYR